MAHRLVSLSERQRTAERLDGLGGAKSTMPRADLLLDLVRAGTKGDHALFRRAVEAMVSEERAKQHHVLADRLAAQLHSNGNGSVPVRPATTGVDALVEVSPQRTLADLILPEGVVRACTELVEEQHRADLLRAHNLEPRHRVLVAGPPGNGKTALAEALASELAVPLFVVRYEAIITSYLGETASRLARLFDQIRLHRAVLFFDEFDVIGKERGDAHETGEIKRVVSSLLLKIDALPSYVVVVTATNHAELLDRAVWRRFQLRLSLPPPTRAQAAEWLQRFQSRLGFELRPDPTALAESLAAVSFAELEEFGADILRRYVLELPEADVPAIVAARLVQWRQRTATPIAVPSSRARQSKRQGSDAA